MFNERSEAEEYSLLVVILELTGHSPHSAFAAAHGVVI